MKNNFYKYLSESINERILYICKYEYEYFLKKNNVVGVGLGYKFKNNCNTFKECIKVFTIKKLTKNKLMCEDIIPPFYKGIATDVVESGEFTMSSLKKKIRPVTGGYNIGPIINDDSGTFGCLVTDGKFYYVLSNNHVIASENIVPLGTPIIQPSVLYGSYEPENEIATLSKFIELKSQTSYMGPTNQVDCAIAKITKRSLVSTKLTYLGRIKGINVAKVGDSVQKVGSTTELTKGVINSIGTTCEVVATKGQYLFLNQIITTKMSQRGDSGAVLLDNKMNALGLLMSDNNITSTFNDIHDVLSNLNVSIVTG